MKMWVCESCGGPAFCQDAKPGGQCAMCLHLGRPARFVRREVPGCEPEPVAPGTLGTPANPRTHRANIVPDRLTKHFDYAAGCEITSRSQLNRVYKEKGLQRTSVAETRRHQGTNAPRKEGIATSYPGQRHHRSTAERPPKYL